MTIKQAADICFEFADIHATHKQAVIRDAASLPWSRVALHGAFEIFVGDLREQRDTQGRMFKLRRMDVTLNAAESVWEHVDDYVVVAPEDRAAVALANRVFFSQDPSTWPPEVDSVLEKYFYGR